MSEFFDGLGYVIQYRRLDQTDSFDPWHTMAAFDALGPAQTYFGKQGGSTWEYRLIDLETGTAPVAIEDAPVSLQDRADGKRLMPGMDDYIEDNGQ